VPPEDGEQLFPEDITQAATAPPDMSLDGIAAYQHEWFTAWMKAGFSRAEALHLLKHQMFIQAHMALHGEDDDSADA
jgi:hypothetical protein